MLEYASNNSTINGAGKKDFGTIKRHWGFTHVQTRNKEKVLGQISILFTAYNLRRAVSVLGFQEILERLKALFSHIIIKICVSAHRKVPICIWNIFHINFHWFSQWKKLFIFPDGKGSYTNSRYLSLRKQKWRNYTFYLLPFL